MIIMKTSDQVIKEIEKHFGLEDSGIYSVCSVGIGSMHSEGYPEVFIKVWKNSLSHPMRDLFKDDDNVTIEVDESTKRVRKYRKSNTVKPRTPRRNFSVEIKKNRSIKNVS